MRRLSNLPLSSAGRRADTDATVMALSGLVLVLIFLLAIATGLAFWSLQQSRGGLGAPGAGGRNPAALSPPMFGNGGDGLIEEQALVHQSVQACTLAAVPGSDPWLLLPLLHAAMSEEPLPPGGPPGEFP